MQKFDSINVIPFIDIMLVLLAIVLTTATFVTNGQLDITLPTASTSSEIDDKLKVEVGLHKSGELFFNGSSVSIAELGLTLAEQADNTLVQLMVDEAVEFHRFVTIVDMLKNLSMDNVSIITRKNG